MKRLLLTALLALAVLAGCGGGDEPKIPRQDAAAIRNDLLEVKRRLRPLVCDDIERDFPRLEKRVAALEEGDVRDTLEDGLDHLRSLIEAECAARREQREETTTTTAPETTTTQPPETTTQPPETTTTQPPDTTTQPPDTTPPDQQDPGDADDGGGRPVPPGQQKREKRD